MPETPTPHYSGRASSAFWRKVNQRDDERHVLYLMGCALQDIESRMLQALASAAPTKKPKVTR